MAARISAETTDEPRTNEPLTSVSRCAILAMFVIRLLPQGAINPLPIYGAGAMDTLYIHGAEYVVMGEIAVRCSYHLAFLLYRQPITPTGVLLAESALRRQSRPPTDPAQIKQFAAPGG